jgi:WD40 repeat protein
VNTIQGHSEFIWKIKQSPFPVYDSNRNYVATADKTVNIYNVASDSVWQLVGSYAEHTNTVLAIEWLDKETLVTGSADRTIRVWSLNGYETKLTINAPVNNEVNCLLIFNTTMQVVVVAAGLDQGNISIYSLKDGRLIRTFRAHAGEVDDLVRLMGSGNLVASSGKDRAIKIWDLTSGACKLTLLGHTAEVMGLKQISSQILASGSFDGTVKLWNLSTGKLIRTLTGHSDGIPLAVDLINNGQTLVSGSYDQTIKLWDWSGKTGQCVNTIQTGVYITSLVVVSQGETRFSDLF